MTVRERCLIHRLETKPASVASQQHASLVDRNLEQPRMGRHGRRAADPDVKTREARLPGLYLLHLRGLSRQTARGQIPNADRDGATPGRDQFALRECFGLGFRPHSMRAVRILIL
jgi:hypothetical protein